MNVANPTAGTDLQGVALTFDDEPSPYTGRILGILDRYDATAIFSCIGSHVAENPELALRIAEHGHSLGNHTWSHRVLHVLTADEFRYEVDATGQALSEVTGHRPRNTRNGSIVLLHDESPEGHSRSRTVEALPGILEGLLDSGYRFVTADDDSVAGARAGAHIPYAVAPAFPGPAASPAQPESGS